MVKVELMIVLCRNNGGSIIANKDTIEPWDPFEMNIAS
jgi:hypothetical protein